MNLRAMLPNLKFLIGGVVFVLLLFAVTGASVTLPDSYTRVGSPPEIGRPMMQGMIAEEPAKAQFYATMVVRRNEELQRLRERDLFRDLVEVASAPMRTESNLQQRALTCPAEKRPDDFDRTRTATALPTSADIGLNKPAPGLTKVPLPPARRAITNGIHRRAFHRRRRIVETPYNTLDQPILQSSLY